MANKDKNLIKVIGSGGKGGGREPFEADDNMFARQHAAFIDAIAEGPIKGLVYGDASILVDETRIRDVNQRTGQRSAASNIQNFRIVEAKGTATQTPNADFFHSFPSAAAVEEIGSAELKLNEPQYHTISSGSFEKNNADYIKITMSTTGMVKITKKGDQSGDRRATNVNFNIDFRYTDNDGVLKTVNKFTTGFQGKVSGKYAHTFGFNIENDKAANGMVDWAIKVTRVGGDKSNDTYEVSNSIYIDSIEASIADKLEYPHTAYIAGAIDAEAFSSIPSRGYEIDGKLVQIPSNHFPIDYNGRKVTVASVSNFAVGDSVKQAAISISTITAEFANKETKLEDDDGNAINGDADDGYLATATCGAGHGITIGNVFTVTIDGVSAEADFWEGTFNCEATTATQFTYTLNAPATSATDPTLKTLSSTTAAGTKTASVFTGGLIDKIDTTNKYLYLRNVSPTSNILLGANITNEGSGSSAVSAVEQVLIPANYRRNSATEKVTAVEHDWDGTFYQSWCNNPAWVYNDIMTNKIYGLGNYVGQSQVNKWELYTIARYCDELVPAGIAAADLLSLYTTNDVNYTGDAVTTNEYEPRFSCNLVIAGQAAAFKVLNDITGIFRGMTYWLNGEVYIVQDSEKDPVYQFTTGNVLNGEFKYEGTANKTRTNQVIVNWNNPQDYYRPRSEIVELEETLQKDSEFLKTDSITAFGCTSRGQARRLGKWKLLSNNLHTNTVTFATSINAAFIRPGDIIQIMDNQKSGKSWGGRIKASSSTSSIKLDRQWEKETDYNYNDYQVTLTFVGYKAIIAQDTATIEVQGSNVNFVRGDEITNWRDSDGIIASSRGWEDGEGDITIDSEEKAVNIFDKDGIMVFVQWTPFTQTETKFIDNSDNADPSTLTINTAGLNSAIFSEAPDTSSMFVISRSAISTGKAKEEAELYRVLQIGESEGNQFEIQALEYSASKFDSIDKNEALNPDRTVLLPSSALKVPPVTNIGYQASLLKLNDNDASSNRITFSWDPPRNIDDASLYKFVREYEVYYAEDGQDWKHAGDTPNTSLDLDGKTSGRYHVRVFTKSVQDRRSEPTTANLLVNFQRAVGPSEGTVGNGDFTINKIGTISGGYSIDGGKVTFSPANQQHDDGRNSHTVTGQPQLDFTGLDHTSTTGGDTGYVYMDHHLNKFYAIAHDETSDQFYAVGGSPFATGTGTITCTPNMTSTATHTPNHILGLDSSNFDPELAVDNVLKFTTTSPTVNHYHRVRTLTSDSEIIVDPAVNITIVDADNQAFSKNTFHTDYQNDTIIGMVQKTGASTYVLTQYGISKGQGAYNVQGTNESHTFSADSDGLVTTSNYAAYSNTYTVERDGEAFTYAASGTVASTFGLTCTAVTGLDATSDVNISGSGVITIDDNSLDDADQFSATATIVVKDLQRDYTISTRIISFTKAGTGADGAAGVGGNNVSLKSSHYTVLYDTDGLNPTPSTSTDVTITADSAGFTDAFFKFTGDGITDETSYTNGTGANQDTFTYAVPADIDNFVNPSTVTVSVSENGGSSDNTVEVASDKITIAAIKSGTDAYTVVNTNQAHAIPIDTNNSNAVTYTGSGTDIRVWKGGALLEATTGTVTAGKFKVTASGTGITPSSTNGVVTNVLSTPSTPTNETIRYADHGSITAATAEIEYSIDCEGSQTITTSQTFNKNATGADGDTGAGTNFVFARAASKPNVPTADGLNVPSADIQWYDDPPSGTDILWSSKGTVAAGGTAYTWGAVFQVEGSHVAEIKCYSDVVASAGASPEKPQSSTYNATNSTITLGDTDWNLTPPSISSNGDTVYSCTALISGSPSDTSISITWSDPTIYARKTDGSTGASVNIVFKRGADLSGSTPSNSSGVPSGWSDSPPSGTDLLWASRGEKAVGATNFVWTTPFQVEGAAHAEVYIYRKNSNAGNSGGSYNFTNNTLTVPTNWVKDPPALSADGDTVYVSVGLATGASTATAASVAWGTPAVYAKRTDGTAGAVGRKVAELSIYKYHTFSDSTTTLGSAPSTGVYNFSNKTVASLPTGWTQTKPAAAVGVFIIQSETLATESSGGTTSDALSWSTPSVEGYPFNDVNFIFRRDTATNTPADTAYGATLPSSGGQWYDDIADVPAGSNSIWVSKGIVKWSESGGTYSYIWDWEASSQIEGSDGADGAVGKKEVVGVLYATAAGYSTTPSMTNYTFSTRVFTGGNASSWTLSPPSLAGATVNTWYQCSYAVTETTAAGGTGTPSFGTPTPRVTGFGGVITLDENEIDIDNLVDDSNIRTYASYAGTGLDSSGRMKVGLISGGVAVTVAEMRETKSRAYAGLSTDGDVARVVAGEYGGFGADMSGATGAISFSSGTPSAGTLPASVGGTGVTSDTTWKNSKITTKADGSLNYDGTTAVAPNLSNITGTTPVAKGGTGVTADTTWKNSKITTKADGSLNYDGTTAVAPSLASLAGIVGKAGGGMGEDISSATGILRMASGTLNKDSALSTTYTDATDNGTTINTSGNIAGTVDIASGGSITVGNITIDGTNNRILITD